MQIKQLEKEFFTVEQLEEFEQLQKLSRSVEVHYDYRVKCASEASRVAAELCNANVRFRKAEKAYFNAVRVYESEKRRHYLVTAMCKAKLAYVEQAANDVIDAIKAHSDAYMMSVPDKSCDTD